MQSLLPVVRHLDKTQDIEYLRRVAKTLDSQTELLLGRLANQAAELQLLRNKEAGQEELGIDVEAIRADLQATLDAAASEADTAASSEPKTSSPSRDEDDGSRTKQSGHGPTPQPELPIVDVACDIPADSKICSECGGDMREIAAREEHTELVHLVELRVELQRIAHKIYGCACGDHFERAKGPERAAPGGRYSLEFGVHIASDKYDAGLPLNRQARLLKRGGLVVTSQTLWDQIHYLARELEPAYDALYERWLSKRVVGIDQTSWKRLSSKKGKPWQMWGMVAPQMAYYRICDDKSAATFTSILTGVDPPDLLSASSRGPPVALPPTRTVVGDMMSSHISGVSLLDGVELAACWAHAFRRFRAASVDFPEAEVAMDYISQLYALDAEAGSQDERRQIRATRSREAVGKLEQWLTSQRTLKSSSIGEAVRYMLNHWPRFIQFLEDPEIWLDNNSCERALRNPVVGRKNHYGSRSRRGTEVAAIYYSLVETAKLNDIDPRRYLRDAVLAARRGEVHLPFAR